MFDWVSFAATLLFGAIFSAVVALLFLVAKFFFWVEERTGIPMALSTIVFVTLVVAIFAGMGALGC